MDARFSESQTVREGDVVLLGLKAENAVGESATIVIYDSAGEHTLADLVAKLIIPFAGENAYVLFPYGYELDAGLHVHIDGTANVCVSFEEN